MMAAWNLALALALTIAPQTTEDPDVALTGHWAFRWTHMYEDGARLVGGGLGVVLDERTRVEVVGYGTARPSRYSTLDFHLAHGGVQVIHELLQRGRWGFGAGAAGGYGVFSVEDRQGGTEERTGVWVVEPEVSVGFDISAHVRLGAAASYRWVTGIEGDITNRSDGDARAPSGTLRIIVR